MLPEVSSCDRKDCFRPSTNPGPGDTLLPDAACSAIFFLMVSILPRFTNQIRGKKVTILFSKYPIMNQAVNS